MLIKPFTSLLIKSLSKLRLLGFLNLYPKIVLGNTSIKLPILGSLGYTNLFPREIWLNGIFQTLFTLKQGAFIDVGINQGQTLLKIIEFGNNRQYIGFEPNPQCCQYVETLRKINHLSEVKIVPVALGNNNFLADLYLQYESDPCACVVEGFRDNNFYHQSKLVPVLRGDEVFTRLGIDSVSILKIDVEGGEIEVLYGTKTTISKLRPFIICEILPIYDEDSTIGEMRRERTDKVIELVKSLEYRIFRLLHNGNIVALESIDTHSDLSLCEYLFVPEEFSETFRKYLKVANQCSH